MEKTLEVEHPGRPFRVVKVSDEEFAVGGCRHPQILPQAGGGGVEVTIHDSETGKIRCRLKRDFVAMVQGLECVGPISGETSGRIVAGDDGGHKLGVFDLKTGDLLVDLPDPPHGTYSIRAVPEWHHEAYVGGYLGGDLRRYDLNKGVLLNKLVGGRSFIRGIDVNLSTSVVLATTTGHEARLWSHDSLECVGIVDQRESAASCLFASDFHRFFIGRGDGSIQVWDQRKLSTSIHNWKPHTSSVHGIMRLDEETFVSIGSEVSVWRANGVEEGFLLKTMPREGQMYGCCTIGTPYDRPNSLLSSEEIEDFEERCRLIFPDAEFLRVSGSTVTVARLAVMFF